jgi:hypothetical protein
MNIFTSFIAIKMLYELNMHSALLFSLGNRLYGSESNTGLITSYKATTLEKFLVFRSNSSSPSGFFCPALDAGYSYTPSFHSRRWTIAILLSWVPISVIETDYAFFPDDQTYTSTGTFTVSQSSLSIELGYRFRNIRD